MLFFQPSRDFCFVLFLGINRILKSVHPVHLVLASKHIFKIHSMNWQ